MIESMTANNGYVLAGCIDYGVFASSNNGLNWTQTSLNNQTVWAFSVNGNYLFAGTLNNGVKLSTNNGLNWTQTTLNNKNVWSMTYSGGKIFAGTSDSGVFYSTNNGTNWTKSSLNNKGIWALAANGNYIFAGGTGVNISTNGGLNWSQSTLSNIFVMSLAVYGNNVFAGTFENGVYLSRNNGVNWVQKNEGFSSIVPVMSLYIANNYIFAGTWGLSAWRRLLNEIIAVEKISEQIPAEYELFQNYPNPFNQSTMFNFQCSMEGMVELKVFDLIGREVATLVNEKLQPGTYEVRFDAVNLPSGIYFYQLKSEKFSETKKLIILK
jgi:hypothetical protein